MFAPGRGPGARLERNGRALGARRGRSGRELGARHARQRRCFPFKCNRTNTLTSGPFGHLYWLARSKLRPWPLDTPQSSYPGDCSKAGGNLPHPPALPPRFGSLPRCSRAVSFFTLACFLFHRLGPFRPRRAPSARPLRSRRAPGPRPGVKIIVILGEFVEKVGKLCNSIGFRNKNMKRLLFFFGAARLFCLESITF